MKAALELSTKPNRDGQFEIYVRIQDGNKRKRVKANFAVAKNQFKSKNHNMQWVRNHPNAKKINSDLRYLLDKYNDVLFTEIIKGQSISPETLIYKTNNKNDSIILKDFMQSKINLMLEYNQRKGYKTTLNKWLDFSEKEKLGNLDFRQIDVNILKGFENYMFKKGLVSSSVYGNLKRIRACFNMAIEEQLIGVSDYIFKAYKMPKVAPSKKEKLVVDELKYFANQIYPDGSLLKNSQQSFLLAFNLAGVRIEDILTLTWDNVNKDRIEYRMSKTEIINSFQITLQIKSILDYFKSINKNNSKLIIPIINENVLKFKMSKDEKENEIYKKEIGRKTSLINKYLKKISEDIGLDKDITNHIARHTFASIAIKKSNGNINFVQNALKHVNSKTTQIYLADLDKESLDDQMKVATDL